MKILLFICFYGLTHGHYLPADFVENNIDVTPTRGQPWPLPQQYKVESTYMDIDPGQFQFVLSSLPNCYILQQAIQRFKFLTFLDGCSNNTFQKHSDNSIDLDASVQLQNLTIMVFGSCDKYPAMDMDEQYRLKINDEDKPNQAILYSSTIWGALRGLETFSQLVYQPQPGKFRVNTTSIIDFPRFSFRGVLLDTSRHFVPIPVILKNLEAMEHSKLNVFHWHIVDDQSFPYVSEKFPEMSDKGAFNPKTHIYTPKDVAYVIEFARLRGIRVLAEFDTPGHTLSWGKSQPELLTPCYNQKGPIAGQYGPVDPTNNDTYTFMNDFFEEVAEVFPDSFIHLGGDEVSYDCWKSNPSIQKFMKAHGFGTNFAKLEEFYMQRVLDIVKALGRSYIVWQEVFDNGVKVKPDTVIHVWKDGYQKELSNVTAVGYKTILSSCWYLNYINYGENWHEYYNCDPQDFNGTAQQKKLVVGGEACMWGEYVDGSNLITRLWPRAAIVAERLWSDMSVKDVDAAIPRFEEFRCRMIKRGLKVEPANGPGFCDCDYLP